MNDELIVHTLCCICGCDTYVSTNENMRKAKCEDCKDDEVLSKMLVKKKS